MTHTMTEWCYLGAGGLEFDLRSRRTKTGFMVMLRHWDGVLRLALAVIWGLRLMISDGVGRGYRLGHCDRITKAPRVVAPKCNPYVLRGGDDHSRPRRESTSSRPSRRPGRSESLQLLDRWSAAWACVCVARLG